MEPPDSKVYPTKEVEARELQPKREVEYPHFEPSVHDCFHEESVEEEELQ